MPRDLSRTRKPDTDLLVESEEHIIIREIRAQLKVLEDLYADRDTGDGGD
ncbi:hypothetical protein FACS189476_12540 [Spirochaetia bacterium]|nr:hypothetical protein FACS189476_12540 [Spirochaetia bacterium]